MIHCQPWIRNGSWFAFYSIFETNLSFFLILTPHHLSNCQLWWFCISSWGLAEPCNRPSKSFKSNAQLGPRPRLTSIQCPKARPFRSLAILNIQALCYFFWWRLFGALVNFCYCMVSFYLASVKSMSKLVVSVEWLVALLKIISKAWRR